jgi:ATP-dependent DNA helicase RecG
MLNLKDPVTNIPHVGPTYAELLAQLSINHIEDLLFHFPVRYSDTSNISKISEMNSFEKKTILCIPYNINTIRTRFGKFITQATVYDTSGQIKVIWFNQPFLSKIIKVGSTLLLNGKTNPKRKTPELYSPEYEILKTDDPLHLGIITPIYRTTEGLSNKWIRTRIKSIFSKYRYLLDQIKDIIPQSIQKSYVLVGQKEAIRKIHLPESENDIKQSRKRLGFDELIVVQIKLLKKKILQNKRRGPKVLVNSKNIETFLNSLEYRPTKSQLKAIKEVINDFKKDYPSNRLLQGDVGCGKTLVAAATCIPVIESGYQAALMAPTSILAKQHYETIKSLFRNNNIKIKLVTGHTKKQNYFNYDVIIGTHALLFRQRQLFTALGYIIVDEQHRFGVKQRETLVSLQKSNNFYPHNLTMTATPIPRSIALTLFSNLDISIIDELPEGRLKPKTFLVPKDKTTDAYKWIKEKVKKTQIFWICPLIEESDKIEVKAVKKEYERLRNIVFPELKIDYLHGKLTEDDKNRKIKLMKQGKIDILISTSVIEVGMDIPNANIIVIEGAERFGLAQLHQLRGRIGRRSNQKSWCLLFTSENVSSQAYKRLKYFSKVNDGLKVAEYDLKSRGPGEVYGIKQAGIPNLKIASFTNIKLIKQTREAAEKILNINKLPNN